jgi:kinesin family protein 6/9
LLIQQRDNEILILLNLINKKRPNGEESSLSIPVFRGSNESAPQDLLSSYHSQLKPIKFPENPIENTPNTKAKSLNIIKNGQDELNSTKNKSIGGEFLMNKDKESILNKEYLLANKEINELLSGPIQVTNEQLMDRVSCFEMFRKSYRKNEVMEEHKSLLKQKFEEGKILGEKVNTARLKIIKLKNQIEDLRKEKAIIGLASSHDETLKTSPEEEGIAQEIEKNKIMY